MDNDIELSNKIMRAFIHRVPKAKNLQLMITFPNNWESELECNIIEKRKRGKVWLVKCFRTGHIKRCFRVS